MIVPSATIISPIISSSIVYPMMPIRIGHIHRIIPGIGIAVGAHTWLPWVPPVGREEAAELWVEIAGVVILQAGFGVEALADIGLADGLR
jgi:hypothetical protein